MPLRYDMYNRIYDDAEPVFIYAFNSTRVYDRLSHKMVSAASLMAQATAMGYTLAAPEIGTGSAKWLAANDFPGEGAPAPTPPASAPITASVTKAPSTTADDTGQITVAGGPADKAYTITVTIKDAASAGDDVQNVAVAKGATAAKAAADIATGVSDPNVTATAAGAVVTVKPKAGSHFTKLSVSVA